MKSLSFLLAVSLAACGGTPKDGSTTPGGAGGGSASKPAAAGDVSLEIPVIQINGVLFEPQALGRPGMPLYAPKNTKLTIAQQRTIFANTKDPVQKEAQAAVLATMLYQESKNKTGDEANKLVTEARQALRDAAAISKDKVDEVTLRLLGSYEIQLEDWAAAEKAWGGLVTRFPKNKETPEHKAWWTYALLRQYKNAEALEVVKAEAPSDKQPLLAYSIAWAKWRTGDDAGAWAAIVAAANGWGQNPNRDALERDVMLFAGRSKTPFEQVMPKLFALFNAKQPAQQYEVLAKLGLQAYQFAGRWADGVAALDKALSVIGTAVPANDKVVIHYSEADFTVRLDQPEAASRHAKAALDALPACGQKCSPQASQDVVVGIYGIARLFHLLYATANDVRYYQPAHDLYQKTIPLIMDQNMRTQAKNDSVTLEKTLSNTKAGTGTHEKQAIGVLLQRHNQEIQACYETGLAANPKLGGTLALMLESDASGEIKGAATEPKAGANEMSAVATCVIDHAKQWKLPKRGMAGNTRIKLTYTLSPKKA
ncbi:MAG TPA: AgmX/PglI C-terminal domain-containing protein [Kofleriaceae bacterium]|nr:AgmX/PglI C-terminal domain-containing protein [Kofleriaceae bacterium]